MNDRDVHRRMALRIRGMHCAGCVSSVERALKNLPGVATASVNLATQRAAVSLSDAARDADASQLAERLVRAVRDAGYDAQWLPGNRLSPEQAARERAQDLRRQRQSIIMALMYGGPVVVLHFLGPLIQSPHVGGAIGWSILSGVLTAMVFRTAAGPMLAGAVRSLVAGSANMDLLVSLGAATAFVSGVIGLILMRHELIMFDAAALIILLVAVGKYLESRSRGHASQALETLASRIPAEVLRVTGGDGVERVSIDEVNAGDVVRVAAHQSVPVDGQIVAGRAALDESMMTGEAAPVERGVGQPVLGGTLVFDGLIDVCVTARGEDSAAARIAELVAEAQSIKPPWQRLADRLAAVFVPIVVLLAAGTFAGWLIHDPARPFVAVERAIAVMVIACPCAMGLAIPTAVLVGTTRAAERGILIRDPSALEAAGTIRTVVLDKTGTLTLGRMRMARCEWLRESNEQLADRTADSENELLRRAAAVEQHSAHPLARAVVEEARRRNLEVPAASELRSFPGRGLSAVVEGVRVLVGNALWLLGGDAESPDKPDPSWQSGDDADALRHDVRGNPGASGTSRATGSGVPLNVLAPAPPAASASKGQFSRAAASLAEVTSCVVAHDDRPVAKLHFADTLHPQAADAVARLHRLGIRTLILSGDKRPVVETVARQVGIDEFEAEMLPEDKLARIRALHGSGVAMVGDGVNDAPALAAADVGIAIGAGADVAREAAAICLVGHSPMLIPDAIAISRAGARVMKQNLFWALAYNVVMIPLAAFAPIHPALASAAMAMSSITVVGNSLRLRRVV